MISTLFKLPKSSQRDIYQALSEFSEIIPRFYGPVEKIQSNINVSLPIGEPRSELNSLRNLIDFKMSLG